MTEDHTIRVTSCKECPCSARMDDTRHRRCRLIWLIVDEVPPGLCPLRRGTVSVTLVEAFRKVAKEES